MTKLLGLLWMLLENRFHRKPLAIILHICVALLVSTRYQVVEVAAIAVEEKAGAIIVDRK
jgi:hypothetical protein